MIKNKMNYCELLSDVERNWFNMNFKDIILKLPKKRWLLILLTLALTIIWQN